MRGKRYNNGVVSKVFLPEEIVPEGWVPGYTKEEKEIINEKIKKTNIERYGVPNPFQSDKIKEKIKKTNLERYGVEHPTQSKEVKNKTRKTNLERYGCEYSFQSEEVKEKIKESMIERYGVEHALQSKEIMDSMKQHNLENLGVENPSQSEEIQSRKVDTSIKKYGTEYPMQSEKIKSKVKQTNLERYGTVCTLQSEEVEIRKRETWIKHYGVDHPSKSEEIKEKKKQTCLQNFGVEFPFQSEEVREKSKQSCREHYGVDYAHQSKEVLEQSSKTCMERYGVPHACMSYNCRHAFGGRSGPNLSFESKLKEAGVENYRSEFPLGSYSYDFKVGNTLIEIDSTSFHNTLWSPFGESRITEDYHKKKSEFAKSNGYHCIHIFEWESMDKVVKMLVSRYDVYARKCELREVSVGDCDLFLNENHLQGTCRGQDIRLGLYYENELISLMTFGKPRYNKNYQYELLRYCSNKNVLGGAEKLFKWFLKKFDPVSVVSYCDKSKFDGVVYDKLGFELVLDGSPSKHWHNHNTGKHITDNLLRQRGFDQLFGTHYGKGTSNEELMVKNGFTSVYDCGQNTYVWRKDNKVMEV